MKPPRLSRRSLLAALPAAVLPAAVVPVAETWAAAATRPQPAPTGSVPALKLAGLSLAELEEVYRRELERDLEFWARYGVDEEYGGFFCSLDWDGTRRDTSKPTMYQGRGLWVYSFLYRHFGGRPEHLEIAARTRDFLVGRARAGGGLWHAQLGREGRVMEAYGGQIYDGLYVALGLQEFARAAGDEEAWEEALRTLRRCFDLYDRSDYGRGLHEYPPGARLQGVEMVLVDLLTRMLEHAPDQELADYQERTLRALTESFPHPAFQLHNEVLRHDYTRFEEPPWSDHVELGYSISNLWSLLAEARRRRDPELMRRLAGRLERHLEVAWDDVYQGLGWSTRVDSGCFDYQKVSYVHQEGMLGCLSVLEGLGEAWAAAWYDRLHRILFEKFPVPGHTAWHTYMDRKFTTQPHSRRRENFHHPRFLISGILLLESLSQRFESATGAPGAQETSHAL